MKNFTHRWLQSGHFPLNWGAFFQFSKKCREDLPPPLSSYAPWPYTSLISFKWYLFINVWSYFLRIRQQLSTCFLTIWKCKYVLTNKSRFYQYLPFSQKKKKKKRIRLIFKKLQLISVYDSKCFDKSYFNLL